MKGLGYLAEQEDLMQSEALREQYDDIFETDNTDLNSTFDYKDIGELYENILFKNGEYLTDFQKDSLGKIFMEFDKIRKLIDPHRLKEFDCFFNSEDEEFLLYRNSNKGLTNVIIHDEELIAFSFIPKKIDEEKVLTYFEGNDLEDLSKVAYLLFSK